MICTTIVELNPKIAPTLMMIENERRMKPIVESSAAIREAAVIAAAIGAASSLSCVYGTKPTIIPETRM